MTCELIVSVDPNESEKSLSDGVTYVLGSCHKTPALRMEFGLTVCLLERPLGAEGIFVLIIDINRADLPSHSEPCKRLKTT